MGITTVGKDLMLQRLGGISATAVNSMGVGNSSTAFAANQTQLLGSTPSPVLQALDGGSPTETAQVLTCTSTFATGTANQTWNEIGLFNGTVNGTSTMFNRIVIGPFTKTSAVSIVAVITITQS